MNTNLHRDTILRDGANAINGIPVAASMRKLDSSLNLVRACLDYKPMPNNASDPLSALIQEDNREPEDKARSISYLYALRRLMLTFGTDNVNDLVQLLDLNFSARTISLSLTTDRPALLVAANRYTGDISDCNFVNAVMIMMGDKNLKEFAGFICEYGVKQAVTEKEIILYISPLIGTERAADAFKSIPENLANSPELEIIYMRWLDPNSPFPPTPQEKAGLRAKIAGWRPSELKNKLLARIDGGDSRATF